MKATTAEIMALNEGIEGLFTCNIPAKMAFTLSRQQKEISNIVTSFATARNSLLEKYAKPQDDRPGMFQFASPEDAQKFQEEEQSLTNEEIDFKVINQININDFDGIQGVKGDWIRKLMPIIKID